MAASFTPILKLRLSDDLTADARFNLNRIDSLASVFSTDSTGTSVIRSQGDISLEPNSPDVGGPGTGGTVSFGTANQALTTLNIYATDIDFNDATLANFSLGNVSQLSFEAGSYTATLEANLSQSANIAFTLPSNTGTSGAVLVTDGNGILSFSNLISESLPVNNIDIGSALGVRTQTDTSLLGDIFAATGTGLTYKAGSITNTAVSNSAGIDYAKLDLTDSIVNTDINSTAAIGYGKLNLADSISDGDINSAAAISYSKLSLTDSLVDADVNSSAAITLSKLAATTASRALASDASGFIVASSVTDTELGYVSGVTSSIQSQLDSKFPDPLTTRGDMLVRDASASVRLPIGTDNQFLRSDGTDVVWETVTTADITENTNLYYTDERAQDAIGTILTDSSTIDFTYNDGVPSITAAVLPGGVDHDSLLNFVADEHVNHSTVSVETAANSGLAGGGNITATRSLTLDVNNLTAETTSDDADLIAVYDSSASAMRKQTRGNFLPGSFTADWITGDGASKSVSHNLGTRNLLIQLYDTVTYETVYVDSIIRTDVNTLDLTASIAPTNTIKILILEVE